MPRSSTKKTTKKTTKKVAKKKTTKKTAAKTKRTKAAASKGALVCANGAECFWVTDGQILSNLEELEAALKEMHKDVFAHHTAADNDFANWVEYVLQDCDCAADLRKSRTPNTAAKVVAKHVRLYA